MTLLQHTSRRQLMSSRISLERSFNLRGSPARQFYCSQSPAANLLLTENHKDVNPDPRQYGYRVVVPNNSLSNQKSFFSTLPSHYYSLRDPMPCDLQQDEYSFIMSSAEPVQCGQNTNSKDHVAQPQTAIESQQLQRHRCEESVMTHQQQQHGDQHHSSP